MTSDRPVKIGVLVVAYNAASTLASVLDRIPKDFVPKISDLLLADNASPDSTYLIGLGYQQKGTDLPLRIIRNNVNLGYGGNQKTGYREAIANELDIVVMLHADGQYAPELLPKMVEPLLNGEADAVFGSRMMDPGGARRGGMPMYKFVGNRILTRWENAMAGMELSEWHSGYRAYTVDTLRDIPFERNSDDYDFDTEIILQLHEAGKRIKEIPIPTFYGDEVCYVNGLKYAAQISRITGRYRLHKMGFGSGELAFASRGSFDPRVQPGTAHGITMSWLASRRENRVLDLGCGNGALGERIRSLGHHVTGADRTESDGVRDRVDEFVLTDLDDGDLGKVDGPFDVIVVGESLGRVREPGHMLHEAAERLAPGGSLIVTVPNFGHWYPRLRSAFGLFDYDQRGILDRSHVRFFTKRSFERLVRDQGLSIARTASAGVPFDVVERGAAHARSRRPRLLTSLDRALATVRPQMFGYQLLYELKR